MTRRCGTSRRQLTTAAELPSIPFAQPDILDLPPEDRDLPSRRRTGADLL
ncbi:hypothetical protein [Amycolatopsis sp. H20-H5]|nr:hypothetical protein [Amycolatopsis sp. H20-H5]MEC3977434.1 hypothetical protein [Amycolatopsis sp. H20-H5]